MNPTLGTTSLLETARRYVEAGLSVIPIRADGSKAASCPWSLYQKEIPGPDEIRRLFGSDGMGIATVCGSVSGDLETIDFDDLPAYKTWHRLMIEQGLQSLLDRLVKIKTPRPGVQLQYRCHDGIEGNQKLARRLVDGEPKALIETRGEGGYVLSPGCPPACHPTGRTYEIKRGDVLNPPVISAEERALMLNTARSLNEYIEPANTHKPALAKNHDGARPGDEFNNRATWKEILEPAGWTLVFKHKDVGYWRRPGKNHGTSATTNFKGSDLFYVFSTNAPHFESESSYTKFAAFAFLNCRGDYQTAARELAARGYGKPRLQDEPPPLTDSDIDEIERESHRARDQKYADPKPEKIEWKLWDFADVETWPDEPLEWVVEQLIPKGGIGFMAAPPKDRKSLLALNLVLHLTQEGTTRKWLGKYAVAPARTLYISREDPRRRVKERGLEICKSYGEGALRIPSPNRLMFLFRDRIALTNPAHIEWLKRVVRENGSEILVLDVLNRMIPGLDQSKGADAAKIVNLLEELNRELQITIIVLDHTRKPQGPKANRENQEPNSFNLYGGIEKYGCADFLINIARTPEPGRIKVQGENKDCDEPPMFLIEVSPKNSGLPKFSWAGDIAQLAGDMKAIGDENRERVFETFNDGAWKSTKEISLQVSMSRSTVSKHITALVASGKLEQTGKNPKMKYRITTVRGENPPRTPDGKLFDDNQ